MQKTALLSRPDGLTWAFLGLGVLLLPLGLYLALAAPPDANQGYLVRIMYLHVPTAWVGYLAFFVTFLYSLLYLFRQDPRHDRVAAASAEIGLVFMGLGGLLDLGAQAHHHGHPLRRLRGLLPPAGGH